MRTDYKKFIRDGNGRCDLTNLFADPEIMTSAIENMADPFLNTGITKVVALDALGFVFGARIAAKLNVGLILMRKTGKLSVKSQSISFSDYTQKEKSFELAADAVGPDDVALIVDDWSETGAQIKAAISLVEKMGAKIGGVTCLNIDEGVFKDPKVSAYKLHSIMRTD